MDKVLITMPQITLNIDDLYSLIYFLCKKFVFLKINLKNIKYLI